MAVGTINMRKNAHKAGIKAALCSCVFGSLLFSGVASAQTQSETAPKNDAPVATAAQPDNTSEAPLADNIQPENIPPLQVTGDGPTTLKQIRSARRDSLDLSTQTQSEADRLLAEAQSAQRTPVSAGVLPTDILSPQALLGTGDAGLSTDGIASAAPQRNDGVVNLDMPLKGALFDLPVTENPNASMFNLDQGGGLCLGTAEDCTQNETRRIDIGYAKNITHGKRGGFNLQLTPRAGLRFDGESQSAVVGALVRIGDNLRDGSDMKSNTWYVFAGADAEAITYSPNSARRLTSGEFHLQDRIIVGDAQAGLGYKLGSADLTLTYFKRQATAQDYKFDEDAAALSITWKR